VAERARVVIVAILQPLQVRLDDALIADVAHVRNARRTRKKEEEKARRRERQRGALPVGARRWGGGLRRSRTLGCVETMHFSHTLVLCSKQNRLVTTRHLHNPIRLLSGVCVCETSPFRRFS